MSTCVGLSNGMSIPSADPSEIWSIVGDILNNPLPTSGSNMLTSPTSAWTTEPNSQVLSTNLDNDLLWNGTQTFGSQTFGTSILKDSAMDNAFSTSPGMDYSTNLPSNLPLSSFPVSEDSNGNLMSFSSPEATLQKALQAIGSGSTANNLWDLLNSSPQAMDILNMTFLNSDSSAMPAFNSDHSLSEKDSNFNFQSMASNGISPTHPWSTMQNNLNCMNQEVKTIPNLTIPPLSKPKILLNPPPLSPSINLHSGITNLSSIPSDNLPPPPLDLTASSSGRLGTPSLRSRRGLPDLLTPRVRPSNLLISNGAPDTPSPKLPSSGVRPRDSDCAIIGSLTSMNKWDPIKSPRGEAQLSPGVRMSNIPPKSPTGGLTNEMARLGMGSPRGKGVLPPLDIAVCGNGMLSKEKRMGRNGASTLSRTGSGNLDCRSPRTPHRLSEEKQTEEMSSHPVLESSGSGKWSSETDENKVWSNPIMGFRKGEKGLGLPSPSGVAAVSAVRLGDGSEGDESEAEEDSELSTSAKDSDGKESFNSGSMKAESTNLKNKQSTKPRSVAERLRRERISVRLQKLKEAMPKTDARIDTAAMLEDAVVYIKSLQTRCKVLERQNAALAQQVVVAMAANASQNQNYRNL